MRVIIALAAVAALVVGALPATAAYFTDDFESGLGNWSKWPGATEALQESTNHARSGEHTALQVEADPWHYASYATFGPVSDYLYAEVWVFEDFNRNDGNPSFPVTNMLALVGDNGTGTPDFSTDYLQLGVVPWFPLESLGYGFRTKYNDDNGLGMGSAGVMRKAGWTNLAIEVFPVIDGGLVNFYIDGSLVGSSQRTGAPLMWVRIGNNSKTYENFWYDDVSIVPEPGSLLALAAGLPALALLRRRR